MICALGQHNILLKKNLSNLKCISKNQNDFYDFGNKNKNIVLKDNNVNFTKYFQKIRFHLGERIFENNNLSKAKNYQHQLLIFFKKLKVEELEEFNEYDCDFRFGFFAGCHKFNFRINFRDYFQGLKPAKYSLLLNQVGIKPDYFIDLILEILDNNFSLNFFEELLASVDDSFSEGVDNEDILTALNLKLHFLVILKKKKVSSSKYFIVPRSCFFFQLQNMLFYYFLADSFYLYFFKAFYDFKNVGLLFQLLIFYFYKLINLHCQD